MATALSLNGRRFLHEGDNVDAHREINTVHAKSCSKAQDHSDPQLQHFKYPHKDQQLLFFLTFFFSPNRKGHFRVGRAHSRSHQKAYKFKVKAPRLPGCASYSRKGNRTAPGDDFHPLSCPGRGGQMCCSSKQPDLTGEGGGRQGKKFFSVFYLLLTCAS